MEEHVVLLQQKMISNEGTCNCTGPLKEGEHFYIISLNIKRYFKWIQRNIVNTNVLPIMHGKLLPRNVITWQYGQENKAVQILTNLETLIWYSNLDQHLLLE